MEMTRHTCLKLEIPDATDLIFLKRTRFQAHFELSITDSLNAWLCNASGEQGFQQLGPVDGFTDLADGCNRVRLRLLSWTFEKEGSELEWRLKCRPAIDSKKLTVGIFDFLMDANIRLSVIFKGTKKEKTWDLPILGSFIFNRRDLFLLMLDSNLPMVAHSLGSLCFAS
ncbi:hypothetical protein WN943_024845 [Citrus x changshan-huyou]